MRPSCSYRLLPPKLVARLRLHLQQRELNGSPGTLISKGLTYFIIITLSDSLLSKRRTDTKKRLSTVKETDWLICSIPFSRNWISEDCNLIAGNCKRTSRGGRATVWRGKWHYCYESWPRSFLQIKRLYPKIVLAARWKAPIPTGCKRGSNRWNGTWSKGTGTRQLNPW